MKISSVVQKNRPTIVGGAEGVSRGVAFGWALSRDNQPLMLQFLLDGKEIGLIQPSIVRNDIAIAASVNHLCGFRFDLKPFLTELNYQKLEIRDKSTGAVLPSTPIVLEPFSGWGVIDGVFGFEAKGWAVSADLSSDSTIVEILIDNEVAGQITTNQYRPDLTKMGIPHIKNGFSFPIPLRWHDGLKHSLTARVQGNASLLRGGGVQFSCKIMGHIDHFSPNCVKGWLCNIESPKQPVVFDLWVNGQCVKKGVVPESSRFDVESALFSDKDKKYEFVGYPLEFNVSLPSQLIWSETLNKVTICLAGSEESVFNRDHVAVNRFDLVQHVEGLLAKLSSEANGDITTSLSTALNRVLYTQIMPQLLPKIRSALRGSSFDAPVLVQSSPKENKLTHGAEHIDVIIPVYKGYQETIECINSVLKTQKETLMEIIVINDKSPDSRLTNDLRKLAAKEKFTLIENEKNLGFVATVNKGMKLHNDRDVLLLNSDTVVPHGWLKKLREAAYSSSNIGTVTPFSNRATIFSLPKTCFDNDMPLGLSVDQMNDLCAEVNPGVVVDVPTAVGFCMYIRRETLDEVGLFDEERWAKGYCEENDFCIRASDAGWRNVAACDVFVQHHGSISFEAEKAPRVAENLAKLHAIYPDYPERIRRFLKADPMTRPRGRVNIALLKQLAPSYILLVVHGLGGGTETAIRNICKLHAENGKHILILRSTTSGKLILAPAVSAHEKTLETEYPQRTVVGLLAEHLSMLNIEYIHYHHTLGFRSDIWRLPALLDVPYDIMIHDFYWVCPRITLIDESGFYCGQPEISTCERCVKAMSQDFHNAGNRLEDLGGSVAEWRKFHGEKFQAARHVVTPSQDARVHIQKYLPIEKIEAIPHPEPAYRFEPRVWEGRLPYRVAILGAIGPHKGSELLLACAKYAQSRDLPLHFVIIGYTDRDQAFAELENCDITGPYKPEELSTIVEDVSCTTALFLSVWPETYSYTLSEAWRHGLYPVALDIGAPAERIRETGQGSLIPFTQNPREVVDALIKVLEASTKLTENV